MITIEKFNRKHLEGFKVQAGQEYFDKFLEDDEYLTNIENLSGSKTMLIDGWPFMVWGIIPLSADRGQIWALVSSLDEAPKGVSKHRWPVFRIVRSSLDHVEQTRIEAHVHQYHYEGHRLLNLLGFINETPNGMRNFFGAEKGFLYARIT